MQAKELFIFNETYPLPLDKYAEFKSRRDGCASNPMCINRLKFDAETFIAEFGKKHGSKIETGEESSFTIVKDGGEAIKREIREIKEGSEAGNTILVLALFGLGVFAIVRKSTFIGIAAILLGILFSADIKKFIKQ